MRPILLLLLFPSIAFARGNLIDIGGLLYIVLGIGILAGIYYLFFLLPPSFINKSNKKINSNSHGMRVWFTFLYTFFVPLIVVNLLGINDVFILVFASIAWILLINFFYTKNALHEKKANEQIDINQVTKPAIDESTYEWELTSTGLRNIKTGNLIPKSFLRQADDPEPGCYIDNYILHTEFIPERKIKITNS